MNYDEKCEYCTKSEEMRIFAVPIAELKESFVSLCRDGNYKGRCVVVLKEHKLDLWELEEAQLNQYMKEVCRVAGAVKKAFGADNVNLAIYGDTVTHIHCHVVPKCKGGPEWGETFLVERNEMEEQQAEFMSAEQMDECKEKLLKELDSA